MRDAVNARDIKLVFHFTRYANLPSIFRDGILPRLTLETRDSPVVFNDVHRIDKQRDASCFSIGHPNYKMLWRLRQDYPQEKWAVLAVKTSILWEKDCAFCVENAASANVTCIPIRMRKGAPAFNAMFQEIQGKPNRATLGIPPRYPTNPQAEVLVFDVVEPRYILGACCQTRQMKEECEGQFPAFQFLHPTNAFSPRLDHAHW